MICCIIGKGSIGKRHSSILKTLNVKVLFIRRKPKKTQKNEISFNSDSLKKANFFIIANPSSLHLQTIKKIIKFNKPIFVEKPFVTQTNISKAVKSYKKLFVLYQMRFDPRISFIKKKISIEKIKKANFIWKSFLPNWHKNEDYKNSYASKKILGGGVIYTMSHEIDTAINLLGEVKEVFAEKTKNKLKIDVEDNIKIKLIHKQNYSSKLELSFASKRNIRKFKIEFKKNYLSWNFFENKIYYKNKYYKFKLSNDNIYRKQMKKLLSIITKKNYEKSEVHIKRIFHTQNVINACVRSLNKKKAIELSI